MIAQGQKILFRAKNTKGQEIIKEEGNEFKLLRFGKIPNVDKVGMLVESVLTKNEFWVHKNNDPNLEKVNN